MPSTAQLQSLFEQQKIPISKNTDGFLFSGNRQESAPRALFLDRRLTPLERNAWQVIRMMLQPDGITAFPTYEQLRPYLTSMPCAEKASLETVARALTVLRLTRWISLVRRRRAANGCMQSNLYVLHDEPLTPYEAMQLDPEYFSLVSRSMDHASKAIQHVGLYTLQEIVDDPALAGRCLPTRIQVLTQRLSQQKELSTGAGAHESEVSKNNPLRNQFECASDTEAGLKSAKTGTLRNPKGSTVRSSINIINTTIRTTHNALEELKAPQRFNALPLKQQNAVREALQHLPPDVQQQVLTEWDSRCTGAGIRKPAAYLFGIIQKAYKGEFNAWAEPQANATAPPKSVPDKVKRPEPVESLSDREATRRHIAHLKEIVNKGTLTKRE